MSTTTPPFLPGSLSLNRRLSQWLSIHADGTVSVRSGKVELGQGIATALLQIVSQELGVNVSRIRMVAPSTAGSPNEGVTAGSMSVHDSGGALRQVCIEARAIYLRAAAARLQLPLDQMGRLEVIDGSIRLPADGSGEATSYWALADDALLDCEAGGQGTSQNADRLQPAPIAQRLDIPDKVKGRPRFIHDMVLPGMLHGRVLHPPSPGAALIEVDLSAIEAMPGVVATVRDGNFLGVIADDEYRAVRALTKLASIARAGVR